MSETVTLDCGPCRACCHQRVLLGDEDDWSAYQHRDGFLAQRADGGCIYLDDRLGCTIYERRPALCRVFHCGEWYRRFTEGMPRPERRRLERDGRGDPQYLRMLTEGRRRAT